MSPTRPIAVALVALLAVAGCDRLGGVPTQATDAGSPVATVSVAPGRVVIPVGRSVPVLAVVRGEDRHLVSGAGVTWKSETPKVATVDAKGRVTAVAPGQATIEAVSQGRIARTTVFVLAAATPFPGRGEVTLAGDVKGSFSGPARFELQPQPGGTTRFVVSVASDDGAATVAFVLLGPEPPQGSYPVVAPAKQLGTPDAFTATVALPGTADGGTLDYLAGSGQVTVDATGNPGFRGSATGSATASGTGGNGGKLTFTVRFDATCKGTCG